MNLELDMEDVVDWLKVNSGKIILLVVVFIAAFFAARVVARLLRRTLARTQIPNASIFVNIALAIIWVLAFTIVLKPVFGVSPTTLFTALGIGGLAVSLGLQATIANAFGGFQLMFSHVLLPGDIVRVSGITGTVTDVTWRQTVLRERDGNVMMIPNSVLNTTTLEKLTASNESMVTIPFTAKPEVDTDALTKELLGLINDAARELMAPGTTPDVRLTGFSSSGITGSIVANAKPGIPLSKLIDAVTRSVSTSDSFTDLAASGSQQAKDLLTAEREAASAKRH